MEETLHDGDSGVDMICMWIDCIFEDHTLVLDIECKSIMSADRKQIIPQQLPGSHGYFDVKGPAAVTSLILLMLGKLVESPAHPSFSQIPHMVAKAQAINEASWNLCRGKKGVSQPVAFCTYLCCRSALNLLDGFLGVILKAKSQLFGLISLGRSAQDQAALERAIPGGDLEIEGDHIRSALFVLNGCTKIVLSLLPKSLLIGSELLQTFPEKAADYFPYIKPYLVGSFDPIALRESGAEKLKKAMREPGSFSAIAALCLGIYALHVRSPANQALQVQLANQAASFIEARYGEGVYSTLMKAEVLASRGKATTAVDLITSCIKTCAMDSRYVLHRLNLKLAVYSLVSLRFGQAAAYFENCLQIATDGEWKVDVTFVGMMSMLCYTVSGEKSIEYDITGLKSLATSGSTASLISMPQEAVEYQKEEPDFVGYNNDSENLQRVEMAVENNGKDLDGSKRGGGDSLFFVGEGADVIEEEAPLELKHDMDHGFNGKPEMEDKSSLQEGFGNEPRVDPVRAAAHAEDLHGIVRSHLSKDRFSAFKNLPMFIGSSDKAIQSNWASSLFAFYEAHDVDNAPGRVSHGMDTSRVVLPSSASTAIPEVQDDASLGLTSEDARRAYHIQNEFRSDRLLREAISTAFAADSGVSDNTNVAGSSRTLHTHDSEEDEDGKIRMSAADMPRTWTTLDLWLSLSVHFDGFAYINEFLCKQTLGILFKQYKLRQFMGLVGINEKMTICVIVADIYTHQNKLLEAICWCKKGLKHFNRRRYIERADHGLLLLLQFLEARAFARNGQHLEAKLRMETFNEDVGLVGKFYSSPWLVSAAQKKVDALREEVAARLSDSYKTVLVPPGKSEVVNFEITDEMLDNENRCVAFKWNWFCERFDVLATVVFQPPEGEGEIEVVETIPRSETLNKKVNFFHKVFSKRGVLRVEWSNEFSLFNSKKIMYNAFFEMGEVEEKFA